MRMIDDLSSEPIYRQIEIDLRQRIANGDLKPGTELPSQRDLENEYGAGRKTIQKALANLIRDGLIESRKGVPATVSLRPPIVRRRLQLATYMSGESAFRLDAAAAGLQVEQQVDTGTAAASEAVAAELDLSAGDDVLRRHRIFTARSGAPDGGSRKLVFQVATSYYPPSVADQVPALWDEDTGPGRSYARIRDAGITLDHFIERIKFRKATPAEARELQLNTRDATVASLTRVAFSDDRRIEFFDSVMPSDAYIFEYRFEAADQRLLPDHGRE